MLFKKKNKEKIKKIRQATPAGCRECSPAEEYEGEEPSCFYFYFIFFASGGQRFAPGISSSIMQPIFSRNWKK